MTSSQLLKSCAGFRIALGSGFSHIVPVKGIHKGSFKGICKSSSKGCGGLGFIGVQGLRFRLWGLGFTVEAQNMETK